MLLFPCTLFPGSRTSPSKGVETRRAGGTQEGCSQAGGRPALNPAPGRNSRPRIQVWPTPDPHLVVGESRCTHGSQEPGLQPAAPVHGRSRKQRPPSPAWAPCRTPLGACAVRCLPSGSPRSASEIPNNCPAPSTPHPRLGLTPCGVRGQEEPSSSSRTWQRGMAHLGHPQNPLGFFIGAGPPPRGGKLRRSSRLCL